MGLDYNPAVRAVQPGNGDYGDLGSRGRVIGPDSCLLYTSDAADEL